MLGNLGTADGICNSNRDFRRRLNVAAIFRSRYLRKLKLATAIKKFALTRLFSFCHRPFAISMARHVARLRY
jgi:hypothetical protein